jgi:hypothetical protein
MDTTQLSRHIPQLKVFEEADGVRFCLPVAPSRLVFKHQPEALGRPMGEILEIVEQVFEGKFGLLLETDPQKALESASGRLVGGTPRGPLATLEVWSLEPESFDVVLKLPARTPPERAAVLLEKFADRTREVTRVVDNLDLIRYEGGVHMTLPEARETLLKLERQTGTQLDAEGLLLALKDLPA